MYHKNSPYDFHKSQKIILCDEITKTDVYSKIYHVYFTQKKLCSFNLLPALRNFFTLYNKIQLIYIS